MAVKEAEFSFGPEFQEEMLALMLGDLSLAIRVSKIFQSRGFTRTLTNFCLSKLKTRSTSLVSHRATSRSLIS